MKKYIYYFLICFAILTPLRYCVEYYYRELDSMSIFYGIFMMVICNIINEEVVKPKNKK